MYNIPNQIILYTEQERVITKHDIQSAVCQKEYEIKNKTTSKVGNCIIYPFKLIKNIIINKYK